MNYLQTAITTQTTYRKFHFGDITTNYILFARHYQMVFRFCQSRICTSASPLFYICLLFPDRQKHRIYRLSYHIIFLTDRDRYPDYRIRRLCPTRKELISVGKTGQNFFGEDFLSNSNQDFTFHLSGAQPSPIKIRVSFGAKISGSEGYIHISYNGTELPTNTSNKITKYYDSHEFLRVASPLKTVNRAEEESTISLRYASTGTTLSAYLDYIRLNYKRKLQLYNGQVCFRFINRQTDNYYQIENSTATTLVWDVTTPHRPKTLQPHSITTQPHLHQKMLNSESSLRSTRNKIFLLRPSYGKSKTKTYTH